MFDWARHLVWHLRVELRSDLLYYARMDGHDTHKVVEMWEFLIENGVYPSIDVAHSSTQGAPNDMYINGLFKAIWDEARRLWSRERESSSLLGSTDPLAYANQMAENIPRNLILSPPCFSWKSRHRRCKLPRQRSRQFHSQSRTTMRRDRASQLQGCSRVRDVQRGVVVLVLRRRKPVMNGQGRRGANRTALRPSCSQALARTWVRMTLLPEKVFKASYRDTGTWPLQTDAAFFAAAKGAPVVPGLVVNAQDTMSTRLTLDENQLEAKDLLEEAQLKEAGELREKMDALSAELVALRLKHHEERAQLAEQHDRFDGHEWGPTALSIRLQKLDLTALYQAADPATFVTADAKGKGRAAEEPRSGGTPGGASGASGTGASGSGASGSGTRKPRSEMSHKELLQEAVRHGALEALFESVVKPAADLQEAAAHTKKMKKAKASPGDASVRPGPEGKKRLDNSEGLVVTDRFLAAAVAARQQQEADEAAAMAGKEAEAAKKAAAANKAREEAQKLLNVTFKNVPVDKAGAELVKLKPRSSLEAIILLLSNNTEQVKHTKSATEVDPKNNQPKKVSILLPELQKIGLKWLNAWYAKGKPANLIALSGKDVIADVPSQEEEEEEEEGALSLCRRHVCGGLAQATPQQCQQTERAVQ